MPVIVGNLSTVKALIEWFCAQGCVLGELPVEVPTPYGALKIRFLHNPKTEKFVSLSDLKDEESIFESEYGNWSRRLGLQMPRGEPN